MTSFLRRTLGRTLGNASPKRFPTSGFELVSPSVVLEEEMFRDYSTERYYPVKIGEVVESRYQVVGKLGFGTTSTVWLAHDLRSYQHVALKIFTRDEPNEEEYAMYQYLRTCPKNHHGFRHVRTALDAFMIPRAGGPHRCIVQKPLWESFKDLMARNPSHRFPKIYSRLVFIVQNMSTNLGYIANAPERKDIKADNILQDVRDTSIFDDFVAAEFESPSPRKFIDGSPIYMSRKLNVPRTFGEPVLGDFGSAVYGNTEHVTNAQPLVYGSPEVMLKMPWSYPVDIWNLGCMIWDIFEDKHLFNGIEPTDWDPNNNGYTSRAHISELVAVLGPPPVDFLKRGKRSSDFFTEDGKWNVDIGIPKDLTLEESEENLEGEDKEQFLAFVRSMLQWRPEDRKTAKELLEHPWLYRET